MILASVNYRRVDHTQARFTWTLLFIFEIYIMVTCDEKIKVLSSQNVLL